MEAEVTPMEAALWFMLVAFGTALCIILWHFFRKLIETMDTFKNEMAAIKIEVAVHAEKLNTIDRWDVDVVTQIVLKVMEATKEKKKVSRG